MARYLKFAFIALLALSIASTAVLHNHSLIPSAPVCPTCAIGADRIVLGLAVLAAPLVVFYTLTAYEPLVFASPSRRPSAPRGPPALLA
ncbi:MAG: hypothetical protein QOH21_1647 [Acidobacteriota bacterium]|jgi:hypothetical protein|nr:hypothetical protein [Acidobacteriota bacterium]